MSLITASSTLSSEKYSLWVALFMAVLVHLLVLQSFYFNGTKKVVRDTQSVAVTILNKVAKKPPKKSNFVAQNNQIGTDKIPSPEILAAPLPVLTQSTAAVFTDNLPAKPLKKTTTQILTTKEAIHSVKTGKKAALSKEKECLKLSMDILKQQLHALGEKIRYTQKPLNQRIKPLQSVNAHKYVAAQYISDWKTKIERIGKLNYPNINQRKGESSRLIMDVGINADGSIYSLFIRQSSGSDKLDQAAKNIVLLSAPFAPLPKNLLNELDILVITRIWTFTEN